jgi:hypothetical protein
VDAAPQPKPATLRLKVTEYVEPATGIKSQGLDRILPFDRKL